MPDFKINLTPSEMAATRRPYLAPLALIEAFYSAACEGVRQATLSNKQHGILPFVTHNDALKGFVPPLAELSIGSLPYINAPFMGIICGPNGSGKTTTADVFVNSLDYPLPKLNADEETARLRVDNPLTKQDDLNLIAANRTDAQVREHINQKKSFLVETVLSSSKYRADVLAAKEKGYCIFIAFFTTVSPEINIDRVRMRALKGGHDVPKDRIAARYAKSHEQFAWFSSQGDILCAIDNSIASGQPRLIAYGLPAYQSLQLTPHINPKVDRVVGVLRQKQTAANPTP